MTNTMNPLIKQDEPLKKEKQDPIILIEDGKNDEQQRDENSILLFLVIVIIVISPLAMGFFAPKFQNSLDRTIKLEQSRIELNTWVGGDLTAALSFTPEQLHLSLGSNDSEIYITWSTKKSFEGKYYVEFCKHQDEVGCGEEAQIVLGKRYDREFNNDDEKWANLTGVKSRRIITYRAKIENLAPNTLYIYRAVSEIQQKGIWYSKTYQFLAEDFSNPKKIVNMAFFGDLGLINGQSIGQLIQDVDNGDYDLIIHNGDFAYDLNTHNGEYGDEFMRLMEPITARVPYQTSVGNHEVAQNFSHYDHRFTMINSGGHDVGQQNNFYYSFNVGPIHFIAFSTEFYYFLETAGMEALNKQYEWLKKDLELASGAEERLKRPWIIVFGHRPMYCSSRDRDDCTKNTDILRKGLPFTGAYALEKLFFDYGVDVELYSHEHMYERFLPIYDGKVYLGNDSSEDYYLDPLAPVHIISGSAGCQERLDPFKNKSASGSVKQISDYGFLRIYATRCMLNFQQYSTDQHKILDGFTIKKTHSQNFPMKKNDSDVMDCMTKINCPFPTKWLPGKCSCAAWQRDYLRRVESMDSCFLDGIVVS